MRCRVVLILLALVLWSCAPSIGGGSPSPAASVPTTTPAAIPPPATPSSPVPSPSAPSAGALPSAVRFADVGHGWLGVEDGILGTDDGGRTWSRQLTAARVTRIWSFDATRAWARAADGTVYRTQDGAHWTAIPSTNPPISDLDPFSPTLLWAIGVAPTSGPQPAPQIGNVLVSDDGGFIWRPVGTHTMWSVCFTSRTEGLGAEGRQIFRTSDGGRTWTAIATLSINDQGPWYPTLTCPIATGLRVQVTEPYAALSHVPYLVFRSTDYGRSWLLEYREGYTLGSTTPPTPGLGSYPSLIGMLPDGNTWILTCSPPADAQDFLVLDPVGTVRAQEKAPFTACARDATFVDDQHGWAIATDYRLTGPQGVVMRTTDGSRTWSRIYP